MNKSKAIILSNIGGNKEFNVNNNIFLWDRNINKELALNFIQSNIKLIGNKNKIVYDNYFSNKQFIELYHSVIDNLVEQ